MRVSFLTIVISAIFGFGIVLAITGRMEWGILTGLLIGVGGAKWLRIKKQEENDEIEFDERVNDNIRQYSLQTFSISNLLLFVYLLLSYQIWNAELVKVSYILIYLAVTFYIAFYIVPFIARKR